MSFLGFPLLIEKAFLRRTEEIAAVLHMIHVMAATPEGSWEGCPHFGVRNLFECRVVRHDVLALAANRMNAALEDLGITHFRIEKIEKETQAKLNENSYMVTLVVASDHEQIYTASVQF